MKKVTIALVTVALLTCTVSSVAQETPAMPGPVKEHEWLQQLVGEWQTDAEMFMEPGQPPVKSQGTESVRPIGGFWVLAEYQGTFTDKPFTGVLSLGYDPQKQKYVGSWIGSMDSQLWRYEGTLDATGKILTLETEGVCPHAPGKLTKFREVIEIKDKNHRVFTSSMEGEDGKWVTAMICQYTRKP
jgi:hypothetical protein